MRYPEHVYLRLSPDQFATSVDELLEDSDLGQNVEYAKYVYVGTKAAQKQVMVVPSEPSGTEPYGER